MFAKAMMIGTTARSAAAGFGPVLYDTTEIYSADMDFSAGNTVVTYTAPVTTFGYAFLEHDLVGKVYAEVVATDVIGVGSVPLAVGSPDWNGGDMSDTYPGNNGAAGATPGGSYRAGGSIFPAGGSPGAISDGDIIGLAVDVSDGSFQFYKNGSAIGSRLPMAAAGGPYRWRFGTYATTGNPDMVATLNQTPTYTVPTGYTWVGNLS